MSLVNRLWYRNVPLGERPTQLLTDRHGLVRDVSLPPGAVTPPVITQLRVDGAMALPPLLAELVARTEQPLFTSVD